MDGGLLVLVIGMYMRTSLVGSNHDFSHDPSSKGPHTVMLVEPMSNLVR